MRTFSLRVRPFFRSASLGLALLLSNSAVVVRAAASEPRTLAERQVAQATALFAAGDEAGSAKLCLQVIAESPDSNAAALAHLYLGLLALNAIDRRKALVEFETSIRIDPLAELPGLASPKAQIVFDQARQYILRHHGGDTESAVPLIPKPASPPPPTPVAAPTLANAPVDRAIALPVERDSAPSLAPSVTCLAVAAAALGVGLGFGVASQQAADAERATSYEVVATTQGNAAANSGRVADVAFAVAGAAGIAGLVLLTIELTSGHTDAPVAGNGTTAGLPLRARF